MSSYYEWIGGLIPEADPWACKILAERIEEGDAAARKLQAEVEKLNSDIRCMIEKAAAQHLPGYRELSAKCAELETQVDRLNVLLKNAAPYVDACHDEAESQHDNPEGDYYMDLGQYEIMQETEELLENIKKEVGDA